MLDQWAEGEVFKSSLKKKKRIKIVFLLGIELVNSWLKEITVLRKSILYLSGKHGSWALLFSVYRGSERGIERL